VKVIIIGGVASGMSAATRLRRLREDAEIIVYEMAEHVSYANCGLPYFVGDVIAERADLLLQTPESLWSRFRIKVKVKHRVDRINRDAKTVTVTNLATSQTIEDNYDYLVIATGAKPRRLDIPGFERVLELRNVTDADAIKSSIEMSNDKSAVILGGGFIGIELAENLRHIGLEVTILQRGNRILSQLDPEIVQPLVARLRDHGIAIEFDAVASRVTNNSVILENGKEFKAGLVFTATGVEPDNALAKASGLKIGDSGGLWVDSRQVTSDQSILAAGDAVEKHGELTGQEALIPLANLANRHGRLIADVIAGRDVHAHAALGTAIIGAFGIALGVTGLTERAAVLAGIDHKVIHTHSNNHAGYFPGATRVSMKVLFDPTSGELLGAQAVGDDGVDKRIDVLATAIRNKMTVDSLMDLELSYSPQFGSAKDPINIVGYVGNNVWNDTTPTIQWHELPKEISSGAHVIDVRSSAEHSSGHIPGTQNIPVDELRDRIDEIHQGNVIVYCAVGQRGHIATQILKSHGFNVKNLDGGYSTWIAAKTY
jgi:NADPH-dependent 2,4-dienoyl-CoA reductase/sulfur reductase-like enzyme/rhodanese-related sulfurtransferase